MEATRCGQVIVHFPLMLPLELLEELESPSPHYLERRVREALQQIPCLQAEGIVTRIEVRWWGLQQDAAQRLNLRVIMDIGFAETSEDMPRDLLDSIREIKGVYILKIMALNNSSEGETFLYRAIIDDPVYRGVLDHSEDFSDHHEEFSPEEDEDGSMDRLAQLHREFTRK